RGKTKIIMLVTYPAPRAYARLSKSELACLLAPGRAPGGAVRATVRGLGDADPLFPGPFASLGCRSPADFSRLLAGLGQPEGDHGRELGEPPTIERRRVGQRADPTRLGVGLAP